MAQNNTKLCDFSDTNNNDFISTPIAPITDAESCENNAALFNLVMKDQFSGLPSEDAATHLNNFVDLCDMQNKRDTDNDIVKLKLFPFSLRDRAKTWFSSLPRNSLDSWNKCKDAFISKYFPPARIISLRNDIMNFKQLDHEHVAQALERMKLMIRNCPTHGLNLWMIIQNFYAGLNFAYRNLIDSAARGTFMETTLGEATKLLDNIMVNYSQWHTERSSSKKVHAIEEISVLSGKMDELMKLFAAKSASSDPNNMPLSTLIENNNESLDVNFVGRNNFGNNAYRCNFNPRPFHSNSSNNYGNSYNNSYGKMPSEFETSVKEFMISQNNFNAMLEEKLLKVDELGRSVDRITLDVDSLKLRSIPPKHDTNESLKAMRISIDECKERTARMHAKRENYIKVCSSRYHENKGEDLRVIDVSPIRSLFSSINLYEDRIGDDSSLRCPNDSEFLDLDAKIVKRGSEEIKTLHSDEPTTLDFKGFNYDNCSLIDCISLLQSVLNSPHAYYQNKAFTKHIVDALMQSYEEKLELEVSIPRKLYDEWEPTIKIKIKDHECYALCDLGASVSTIPKTLCDLVGFHELDDCSLNLHLADSTIKKPMGRINDVITAANRNYMPVDFIVLEIDCNPSCHIILRRPFLRTIGAIVDMKEGNIRFQFPLRKGMEHFPRKKIKLPYESIMRATYGLPSKDGNT